MPSGSYFTRGLSTINYLATDASGLAAMCSFQISVIASADVNLTCPPDVVVPIADGALTRAVTYPAPNTTDRSTPMLTQGFSSGEQFPVGNTTVTYTLLPQSKICSFVVTVTRDASPSFILCPFSFVVNVPSTTMHTSIDYGAPIAQDAIGGNNVEVTLLQGLVSGSQFPVGQTLVRYGAWDATTHASATCNFTVTVQQNTTVILSCPSTIRITNNVPTRVSYDRPITSDGSTSVLKQGLPSGAMFSVGITHIAYQNGQSSCDFDVIVSQGSQVICPADVVLVLMNYSLTSAVVTYPSPIVPPGTTYALKRGDPPSGSYFPRGSTAVTFTTTGNRDCPFTVTVTFIENCPQNMVFELGAAQNEQLVTFDPPRVPAGVRLVLTSGTVKYFSRVKYFARSGQWVVLPSWEYHGHLYCSGSKCTRHMHFHCDRWGKRLAPVPQVLRDNEYFGLH
jgi:hypothetical protein